MVQGVTCRICDPNGQQQDLADRVVREYFRIVQDKLCRRFAAAIRNGQRFRQFVVVFLVEQYARLVNVVFASGISALGVLLGRGEGVLVDQQIDGRRFLGRRTGPVDAERRLRAFARGGCNRFLAQFQREIVVCSEIVSGLGHVDQRGTVFIPDCRIGT